jgi:hypothetical protein
MISVLYPGLEISSLDNCEGSILFLEISDDDNSLNGNRHKGSEWQFDPSTYTIQSFDCSINFITIGGESDNIRNQYSFCGKGCIC